MSIRDKIKDSLNYNDWVKDFEKNQGRPPRVLHIGNIANNAYLNAKILNEAGLECDVLCYDYYHIMGCPEWEDANFSGEIKDYDFPDWFSVNTKGFHRPKWFVQGPLEFCAIYLKLKNKNSKIRAWLWWQLLNLYRYCLYPSKNRVWIKRFVSCFRQMRFPFVLLGAFTLFAISGILKIYKQVILFLGRPKEQLFTSQIKAFNKIYNDLFYYRGDDLKEIDLKIYKNTFLTWFELFRYYDIVQGYATDGVFALLCDKHPYIAYEHGTIRNIPFEPTLQGKLTALTYSLADNALITNCDNIISAQKLNLTNYKFIPHPVNEEWMGTIEWRNLRSNLLESLNADFIIFHPARQHWDERRHPDWEKGNDILIRGFARFIKEINPKGAAVFVEWGKTVRESKQLLQELGVCDRIKWILPQCSRLMLRYIMASDLVADQFFLGSFGSITPKALACGRVSLLYLNEDIHRCCFQEIPPVINAKTSEEVFKGLCEFYIDPNLRAELERKSMQWYKSFHANKIIKDILLNVYKECIFSSERWENENPY
ncbi:MAG: hypothetical protein A4E56_01268 [Pelotomaculum sp. PtaU1.Bin065]|nr:MAG: hypothetical protein A4E56_01268 [Pelotomaculum sp. PtaU1.Bin065]